VVTLVFRRYNVYLRVNTIMKKVARNKSAVKLDAVFLPKRSRVLNKRAVTPAKRARNESVVPVSNLLDSQSSIKSLFFDGSLSPVGDEDGATVGSMPQVSFTPLSQSPKVKLDAVFLPKSNRLLNKQAVKPAKRARDENFVPVSNLLDSQSSITSLFFGGPSSQGGDEDGATVESMPQPSFPSLSQSPKSLPRSPPLTPLLLRGSLTHVSPGLSLTQAARSPILHYHYSKARKSFATMLTMAQAVIRRVKEAADLTSTSSNENLTAALSRAATSAKQLHDAILAADL